MATAQVAQPVATVATDGGTIQSQVSSPQAQSQQPHNVKAVMNYYNDPEDGNPPPPYYVGVPESKFPRNKPSIAVEVTVTDITGNEDKYTLDSHGFQIVRHESKEKEFLDDEKIKRDYYLETEELLKNVTGATRVFIFDHTIRRKKDSEPEDASTRGPVRSVHIDQSYRASVERVRYHLPDEAETLLQKRFQIINVWRPIKTILRDPLGVADANSVEESDLVAAALIYPHRKGEVYEVKPNPAHRWYFKYAQRPDEVTLIKCYDSETRPGLARRVPHSSFIDPAEEDKEPRESIELRALVFYG